MVLWKKENDNIYRDPFNSAVIGASDVKIWTKIFSDSNGSKKCQHKFMELNQLGNKAATNCCWDEAINYFNQALSYTQRNTVAESILYVNRAQCFSQLGMHNEALTDYELAMSSKTHNGDQFLNLVDRLRAKEKWLKLQKMNSVNSCQPEMNLNVNYKFPCMVDAFEINKSETFGRYISSSQNIPVGETVFKAEPFAVTALPSKQTYCAACFGIDMNFIPCHQCNALFCDSCSINSNGTHAHYLVCGTNFDGINDINLKLIIQSVLVAISMFSSFEDLMTFVENIVIDDNSLGGIPESAIDCRSRYAVFLGLAQSEINTECLLDAYLGLKYLTGLTKLNNWFNNERKKRFFMNLLVHHAAVIPKNMFQDTFNNIVRAEIYDVLSLFNHSCVAQLEFRDERKNGKISQLVTRLPIKKGEQVFINYLAGGMANEDGPRKAFLRDTWGFCCECYMCTRKKN